MTKFPAWLPRDHAYPENPFKRMPAKDLAKKKRRKRKAARVSRRLQR